jgi:hypothetical protein
MADELHGLKTSAGMMLSKHLRKIAAEHTEVGGNDPENGQARIITKAEALARVMWKLALGYSEETRIRDEKTGKVSLIVKEHKPDNTMISLIWDRLEGKVSAQEDKAKKQPLSHKVDEQIKQRINALTGDSRDGDTETASA